MAQGIRILSIAENQLIFPTHSQAPPNSSSMGTHALFWLPQVLHAGGTQIHKAKKHTNTQNPTKQKTWKLTVKGQGYNPVKKQPLQFSTHKIHTWFFCASVKYIQKISLERTDFLHGDILSLALESLILNIFCSRSSYLH